MRRHWKTLGLCAALGCGAEETAESRLQGSWIADEGDVECSNIIDFDDGVIEVTYGCALDDNTLGLETIRGDYEIFGDVIDWEAFAASCDDTEKRQPSMRFEFVGGDRLRLTTPTGVFLMERNKLSSGNGSGEFGCFDDEGYFESQPVQPL